MLLRRDLVVAGRHGGMLLMATLTQPILVVLVFGLGAWAMIVAVRGAPHRIARRQGSRAGRGSRVARAATASGLPTPAVTGIRFALDTEDTIRSFDPGWAPPAGGHRIAVAFLFDSPNAVDETFVELVNNGARPHKEPWDAFWGQRYAQIHDPDGNVVDLFAQLSR